MPSPYSITLFPAVNFTATSQTSAAIALGTKQGNGQFTDGSWASAAISLSGVSLATATFGLLGSADGGVTYNPIAIQNANAPGTTATTFTATGAGCYQVSLAGLTHVRFVTSGTFTGTSISLTLAASPNAPIGVRGPAGASGGSALVVGTTTITNGTNGSVEFNNAGVLGEKPIAGSGAALTSGPASTVANELVYFPDTTGRIADSSIAVGSVVLLTATQTLTNKTLTAPAINGGAINAATIGATTPATGKFTTLVGASNTLDDGAGNIYASNSIVIGDGGIDCTGPASFGQSGGKPVLTGGPDGNDGNTLDDGNGNAALVADLTFPNGIGAALSTGNVALGAGAGTGGTFAITGNDGNFQLKVTAGTLPTAGGIIATITYNVARGANCWPVMSFVIDGATFTVVPTLAGISGGNATVVIRGTLVGAGVYGFNVLSL